MKLGYLVCSQSAIIDQTTNQVSILRVIEQVNAATFPIVTSLTVACHLVKEKKDADNVPVKLRFRLDGKPVVEHELQLSFQGKPRHRIALNIEQLVIERPGVLTAELVYKNHTLGSWLIEVLSSGEKVVDVLATPAVTRGSASRKRTGQRPKRRL